MSEDDKLGAHHKVYYPVVLQCTHTILYVAPPKQGDCVLCVRCRNGQIVLSVGQRVQAGRKRL